MYFATVARNMDGFIDVTPIFISFLIYVKNMSVTPIPFTYVTRLKKIFFFL